MVSLILAFEFWGPHPVMLVGAGRLVYAMSKIEGSEATPRQKCLNLCTLSPEKYFMGGQQYLVGSVYDWVD